MFPDEETYDFDLINTDLEEKDKVGEENIINHEQQLQQLQQSEFNEKDQQKIKEKNEEEEDDDEDGLGAVISFIKSPIVQKDSSSKSSKPDQTNSDSTIEQIIPNLTSSLSLSTKKDSEKNTSNNKQGKTGNIGKIKGKNAQGNNKGKSSSSNSGGLAYPTPTYIQKTPQMHYLCDAIIRFIFDDAPDPQVLNFEIIGEVGGTMIRSG
ncbi:MAG: hypothetical protein EZS28_019097 [Streblomastix strix]|uniref:Uncharacterized protein n=1 Tax=Streblomastix strix TaxID=222440 RepID=A0A5J4VS23_9EUKA|nr:MAG: hypothetical protein EZS28_019097 [Streblomastix strix]